MSGKLITFEGPEGCGKSTQIDRLTERLSADGIPVVATREPGGTATGELIRGILQHNASGEELDGMAEVLLFAASRAQLMNRVIHPALDSGTWVLCDRFIDSTLAYQGYGRSMDIEVLERINNVAIGGRKPDLTILLDLDIEEGFKRLDGRYAAGDASHDRFEREARDFHCRVRTGYLKLAEHDTERFCVIDADQTVEAVDGQIWSVVQKRFF